MSKPKYINWDKCIHIHACRRFATIVERKTGKKISRGCGKDCEAYEEHDEKTIEKACKWLEEHGDSYACADYVPELDYTPKDFDCVNFDTLMDGDCPIWLELCECYI